MNKTVYLRDDEVPVWERARELSGDKLSPVIVAALKRFVAEKEATPKGFERIELSFEDSEAHFVPKRKAFYGRWIYPPRQPFMTSPEEGDEWECHAIAVTPKGNIVFYSWHNDPNWSGKYTFSVYSSLKEAAADPDVNEAARQALERIGVPLEELDI